MRTIGEIAQDMHASWAAEQERRTRLLLSAWVSEIEPVVAYGPDRRVIGLSHGSAIVLRLNDMAER